MTTTGVSQCQFYHVHELEHFLQLLLDYQAFPDPSYAAGVLAVPASCTCTLTQTNDPPQLLTSSDGAVITSRLSCLLDIWPSARCLPSSRPLACWLGRPDRPVARQQLTSPNPPDRIDEYAISYLSHSSGHFHSLSPLRSDSHRSTALTPMALYSGR